MEGLADHFAEALRALTPSLLSGGAGPSSHDRFWWPCLAASGAIAVWALWRSDRSGGLRRALARLAPRAIWRRRSARTDIKLLAVNFALRLTGLLSAAGAVALVAQAVAGLFGAPGDGTPGLWAAAAITLAMAMALDLSEYVAHRLCHALPALWAFHRVHHSAHVLTPLTAYRMHPLEMALEGVTAALIAGPVLGVAAALSGGIDLWLMFGGNAVIGAANMTFANLRHSHVWIRFPKPLCYIFSDPAQHQIHHSRSRRHWDRNYGEIFALWDWMFGTLHIPSRTRERISFGLGDARWGPAPDPHPTLIAALVEPFSYFRPKRAARPKTEGPGAMRDETAPAPEPADLPERAAA